MFPDEQEPQVSASAWFSAASGLSLDYYGSGNSSRDIPADLDAMATICAAHVEEVLSMVPAIFVLDPVVNEGGAFGNGENVWSSFDFSCQGTRNAVIGVIGGFRRAAVIVPLP